MSLYLVEAAKRKTAKRRQSNLLKQAQVQQHLKILDKKNRLIPFRLNRAQRHLSQRLTGRDLILKARQLGFSTYIRATHETKAMTTTSRLATLAHDQDTTDMLRRMSKRFWEHLPDDIRPARGTDNASTTIYSNTDSEVIIKTAGSRAGGRGGTLSDVHGSEVAHWKNANDNMAGIMQAVPLDGNIVLESTANGAQGLFYENCMEALDGNSIWTLHFYEWWWSDDYRIALQHGETLRYTDEEQALVDRHGLTPEQIKWRRYKIKELSHTFLQEYPEDVYTCFLASGESYFGNIEDVFTAPANATYDEERRYVAGLDFAQDNDYTVLKVLDARSLTEVDSLRVNKLLWSDMRYRIKRLADKWSGEDRPLPIYAESNAMGKTNIELLQADGVNITPFKTTAKNKPMLIQNLYACLHEFGLTLLESDNMRHELRNFVSKQTPSGNWQYEGANGAHDDEVMSLAFACYFAIHANANIQAI